MTPKSSSARVTGTPVGDRGEQLGVVAARGARRVREHQAGASVPYRRTSRAGALEPRPARRAAAAPSSGRSRVRHGPAASAGPGDGGVDGVLGHPAVGRELAADDGDHAVGAR